MTNSEEAFMTIIRRHKRVAILAGLAVFVMAGVAGAYWTQNGTGTGTAASGTTASITVNQTSTITGLYPGGPSTALGVSLTNTNAGSVFVNTVTAAVHAGWSSQGDLTKPACTAADFTIAGSVAVNAQIPTGTTGTLAGLTIQMVNRNDVVPGDGTGNQDNCKNVTVPIDYTAS
jgi:hypothetical protein